VRARVNDVLVGENSESEKAESRAYEYGGKVTLVHSKDCEEVHNVGTVFWLRIQWRIKMKRAAPSQGCGWTWTLPTRRAAPRQGSGLTWTLTTRRAAPSLKTTQ
jgi:hypothetical protein